ncbi:hypothetical protein K1W69_25010 [Hoeflea sp. WL0058]|uniref:Uncharacterized protein n=1 Tax=Flavimaribacter sediminis TaxID=2865987 RepID=A0AAE3D448_9HYPH|nr:hypothetical protein [Flavimaribacter sediminis]MBW8640476.1 hypothetical protein [Flavimaribacter sediminis]
MARIPTYFSNASLNTDRGGMPRAPVDDAAGKGLQQLGAVISRIRLNLDQNTIGDAAAENAADDGVDVAEESVVGQLRDLRLEEAARFDFLTELEETVGQAGVDVAQTARQHEGDPGDFYSSVVERIVEPRLSALRAKQPEHMQPAAAAVADRAMEPVRNAAAVAQSDIMRGHRLTTLADAGERAATAVREQPAAYDDVMQGYLQKVALSGLPDQTKEALGGKIRQRLATALVDNYVDHRPDEVGELLGVSRQQLFKGDGRKNLKSQILAKSVSEGDAFVSGVFDQMFRKMFSARMNFDEGAKATAFAQGWLGASPEGVSAYSDSLRAFARPAGRRDRGDIVVFENGLGIVADRTGEKARLLEAGAGQAASAAEIDASGVTGSFRAPEKEQGDLFEAALANEMEDGTGVIAGEPNSRVAFLGFTGRLREEARARGLVARRKALKDIAQFDKRTENARRIESAIDRGDLASGSDVALEDLTPADRARLDARLSKRFESQARSREFREALSMAHAATDGKDPRQAEVADQVWAEMESRLKPENLRRAELSFLQATGYLPARVRIGLEIGMDSEDRELRADAMSRAKGLLSTAPGEFDRNFSTAAWRAELDRFVDLTDRGYTPHEAIDHIARRSKAEQRNIHAANAIIESDTS